MRSVGCIDPTDPGPRIPNPKILSTFRSVFVSMPTCCLRSDSSLPWVRALVDCPSVSRLTATCDRPQLAFGAGGQMELTGEQNLAGRTVFTGN